MKIVKEIERKGYPTASHLYPKAHSKANKEEKKSFPKGYEKLKKVENKVPKGQLIGSHSKSGKIKIAKIVPNKLRHEVAMHEKYELRAEHKLRKKEK